MAKSPFVVTKLPDGTETGEVVIVQRLIAEGVERLLATHFPPHGPIYLITWEGESSVPAGAVVAGQTIRTVHDQTARSADFEPMGKTIYLKQGWGKGRQLYELLIVLEVKRS